MIQRVVVINDVATARGGATGIALLSIRLLRQMDVPVTFIVGDEGNNPELRELGVDVVPLGGTHVAGGGSLNAMRRGLYNAPARRLVADWVAAHDAPGVVYHLHGWSKILSPAIFGALAPVARRTLFHAHDFFLACPNGAFQNYRRGADCGQMPLSIGCLSTNCDKRSYAQKIWRVARQGCLSLTSGRSFADSPIVMVHERMADYFTRAGFCEQRLLAVRNPVTRFTDHRIEAERNRDFYFVGRIEFEKGIDEAALAAKRAGVRLRILGDGPDRSTLEARHPHVDVLGWSSRETIRSVIRNARALLMPSRYPEPFGLVAAEASRSGLPVILSTNALLSAEFVQAGLGFACDTRDIEAFAATIRHVADMPAEEVRAMSELAFSGTVPIATTPLTWRDRLMELYEERLSRAA